MNMLRLHIPLLLALLLGLAACSGDSGQPGAKTSAKLDKTLENRLLERVSGKWRAMEERDFAAVYEYTTPNYREVFPKDLFLNKFGYDVRWELTGVEIVHYDADAAVASVAVRVMSESAKPTTRASTMGAVPNVIKEAWFLVDGEWWFSAK